MRMKKARSDTPEAPVPYRVTVSAVEKLYFGFKKYNIRQKTIYCKVC